MFASLLILSLLIGVPLLALVATAVHALRTFSRRELDILCRRRQNPLRGESIVQSHERVAQSLETLVALGAALLVAGIIAVAGHAAVQPISLLRLIGWALAAGLLLAAIVFRIPASIARLCGTRLIYRTWPLWSLVATLLTPVVALAGLGDALLRRYSGRKLAAPSDDPIEAEIRTLIGEGHREGLLEEDAREMIEGVMELNDAAVADIMTPRTDMAMISQDMPWPEVLEFVIEVGHSRIPVFDKHRDDIVGILYSKDLLAELAAGQGQPRRPLADLLRPAFFVPETKKVNELLQELWQTRNHLAIVLDEYGGVAGLVTIEDVLEEIVGEIIDEYDEELVEDIRPLDDSTCEVLGRAHLDEINSQMGLALPDDGDYDTIGGFVFHELGRIPTAGESIIVNEALRITVLEASRRRIERLRIERLNGKAETGRNDEAWVAKE